jgi:hypothetical protein
MAASILVITAIQLRVAIIPALTILATGNHPALPEISASFSLITALSP